MICILAAPNQVEMPMKTVFVPLDDPEVSRPIIETSLLFAQRFGSYVEGAATLPVLDNYIVGEMVPLWPPQQRSMGDIAREAYELFNSTMSRHNIPVRERSPNSGVSQGWHEPALLGDGAVASHARIFDVTVVGRPVSGASGPRLSLLETIVFESGRPILIAPPDTPTRIGENIVIAWNCSTETARTTAMAMPLLHMAKRVTVLTVEEGTVPGPSGHELARMLRINGIDAEPVTISAKSKTAGEAVLDFADGLDSDLLIKGAYTQSRLRQMIFGGVTSHILAAAKLPVFMTH